MTNTIPTLDLIDKSFDFIGQTINKIDAYRKLKSDKATYLRLLYLENIYNMEILNTLDLGILRNTAPNDKKCKVIIDLLETGIAEGIFYRNADNSDIDIYRSLEKKGKVENKYQKLYINVKGVERIVKQKFIYLNVLQAISFIVTKIKLLQRLSTLTDDELQEIIKKLRLDVRFINLNQRMLMVKQTMNSLTEISSMAR